MKIIFRLAFLLTIMGITPFVHAGMGGGGGGGGNGMGGGMGGGMGPPCGVGSHPPCPMPVPIDGGILLLAGAGIYLGAKKSLKRRNHSVNRNS
jgi:hypothetical protein